MASTPRKGAVRVVGAAALTIGLLTAGLSTGAVAQDTSEGVDDGSTLTLWTRAATEARATPLVDAYNATHENQVEMAIFDTDAYQTTVAAAAGSGSLPDLFSADVVFMPNWTSAGLFTDLTEQIDNLGVLENVAPAHIDASTWDGKKYGMPFIIDLSVWMWNKDIYEAAGLDPEAGPTSLAEFEAQARAVSEAGLTTEDGKPIYGTFFGGNCGGCQVFTWFPIIWASGEQVMNEAGTEAFFDSDAAREVFAAHARMYADGTADPFSTEEVGPTWTGFLPGGTVGVMPMPASLDFIPEGANFGVTPIAGVDGGESTFVGGDSIGVSKDSDKVDQAWNFMSWLQSEEAQVGVVSANGGVVSRTDLADNEFSSADPRLVAFNEVAGKGVTPIAVKFGETYNNPQGPWLVLTRNAVFRPDDDTVEADNDVVTETLQ
jgi:multiple sugar transport system substrate-binding protein